MHQVVPALTYFFWVRCHPSRTFPLKNLKREPRLDPLFSLPPNHTLWIPWPMAHFPFIEWVQVGGVLAFCAYFTSFEFDSFWPSHHFCCPWFVWFYCTYWLMFIFCGVKVMWAFGLIFSSSHPFLDWVSLGQKPSSSCWAHASFFMAVGLFGY